ncbi:unnamed protein product [Didymodactylos carnosus]|nr:unnamed protein product [Didymodactylos carnosus]CAF3729857.1 unnamed protein product [Didymodactylos carnosus]
MENIRRLKQGGHWLSYNHHPPLNFKATNGKLFQRQKTFASSMVVATAPSTMTNYKIDRELNRDSTSTSLISSSCALSGTSQQRLLFPVTHLVA